MYDRNEIFEQQQAAPIGDIFIGDQQLGIRGAVLDDGAYISNGYIRGIERGRGSATFTFEATGAVFAKVKISTEGIIQYYVNGNSTAVQSVFI